ncbi:lytic transglycosylase domain-containing protein [Tsuneonella sp. HG249]
MILGRVGVPAALALTCAAVPAHADVMEIGPQGPRWVSGALAAGPAAETPLTSESIELGADFAVPPHAIADAARQAGIVPVVYAAKVTELADRFDLSPALIEALVWQESRWNAAARSPVGARGLAQLMPGTARYLGVDPDDPFANLEGGARYLREQMDRFEGDIEKALAAYNAGPGRVIKAGGIPRIRETQGYVAAIMGRLSDHSRDKN